MRVVTKGVGMSGVAGSVGASELAAEAEYLAAAQAALRRMRSDVLTTETPEFASGTDEVWFNTMYRLARVQRAVDLVDLPGVPLFFGRLDLSPSTATPRLPWPPPHRTGYVPPACP